MTTNPAVWDKLSQNQAVAGPLSDKIIGTCRPVVETSSPEVLYLMAQFASRFGTAPAQDLLLAVADARIKRYAEGTVKYELVDTGILKLLAAKVTAGSTANQALAQRFAQLYSYAVQRYLRALRDNDLRELSGGGLASVLVETEQQCLGKLLGTPQTTIMRAVEAGDSNALQAEHDKLLGSANQAGSLPSKFNFSYGSAQEKRTAPLALPEPPGRKVVAEPKPPAQPPETKPAAPKPPEPKPPAKP